MHASEERNCVASTQDRDDVGPDCTATSNKIEEERDCLPSQTPTLNGHDYLCSGPEATAEDMIEAAQQRIRELEAALEKTSLSARFQLKPHNLIRFYTGFPSYQVLITTFFLRLTAEKMYSWSQIDIQTDNGKGLQINLKTSKLKLVSKLNEKIKTEEPILTFNIVNVILIEELVTSNEGSLDGKMVPWKFIYKRRRKPRDRFKILMPKVRMLTLREFRHVF